MKQQKSLNHYMRSLHRDIGFLVIGLVIIYALSGIILTYRDTDFLKKEVKIDKMLPPNLEPAKLAESLRLRDLEISRTEGNIIYFAQGSYDRTTGRVEYVTKEVLPFLNKFFSLHKSASKSPVHLVNLVFGVFLIFLAVSSFWMHKRESAMFKRGIYLSIAGIIIALLLVYL